MVEQLSDIQATIRWALDETKATTRYTVELNGETLRDVDRGCDFAVLGNLAPGTGYTVTVTAIGANDRYTRDVVSFQSLKVANESAPLKIGPAAALRPETACDQSPGDALQLELADVLDQQQQAQTTFEGELARLQRKLDGLSQSRRKADQERSHQRAEVKTLEETKRALELAKSKAKSRYSDVQVLFNNQHSTQNRWTTEIEQWQQADDLLERSKAEICKKHVDEVERLQVKAATLAEELAALQNWIQNQTKMNEAARAKHADIVVRLEQLRKNTDLATGQVPKEILDKVAADSADSVLIDFLVADCAQDAVQESRWLEMQRQRESQYVEAYAKYQEAARTLREATAQAQAHAKAQAHRASASIASSGSNRSLSSMVSHAPTATSFSTVFSQPQVVLGSGLALSPATSGQAADYQFDSPALHSWLAPRRSLESSRSSSIFFGPAAQQLAEPAELDFDDQQSEQSARSEQSAQSEHSEGTGSSSENKSPRKKKLFFTLEPSTNRRSFVRRLSIFPKKDDKRAEQIEESDEASAATEQETE